MSYHPKVFNYVIYNRLIMKLLICVTLMLIGAFGVVAGDDYSHKYETFEIGFSTPLQVTADVQWGVEKAGMLIKMNLSTGEKPSVFPHIFSSWDSRAITRANLERIWASYATGNGYALPTISELSCGDYLVSGSMMNMDSKIKRTMRTFDFDNDGRLDFIVFWNGDWEIDLDLLNYLASTTTVNLISSKVGLKSSDTAQQMARKRSLPAFRQAFVGGS